MAANVEAMVRAGIEAYRGGKSSEARKLLEKAIELDDYNEQAWMWLSAVVETEEEKRTCLENVLVINPDNEEAQRGLKMLGVDGGSTATATASGSSNPFTDAGLDEFGDVDFTADIEEDEGWTVPTSSASSNFQGSETSAQEYDSWVDNLNLGGEDSEPSVEASPPPASSDSNFDNTDMRDMFGLDDDDDFFGTDDPFGSEPQFGNDDDDSSITSGPFGASSAMNDDFGLEEQPKAPVTQSPPAQPVRSPGAENVTDDNFLDELGSADFSGGDFIIGDADFDSSSQADLTPDELFSFIPDNISATRLPGTKQGVAITSLLVLVVLIAMNIGAVVFLVSSIG